MVKLSEGCLRLYSTGRKGKQFTSVREHVPVHAAIKPHLNILGVSGEVE